MCTPEIERSWCHTASYTSAVAAIAALHGDDISELPAAVEHALQQTVEPFEEERVLIVGAGRDWPTAQEAALKLREGAWVDATAYQTETLLHGHLAAVDETVRAYVLEGEGRAAERAAEAVSALETLGCRVDLMPTEHPVVDIVRFHLLTLAVAEARGIDPDPIRRAPGSPGPRPAARRIPTRGRRCRPRRGRGRRRRRCRRGAVGTLRLDLAALRVEVRDLPVEGFDLPDAGRRVGCDGSGRMRSASVLSRSPVIKSKRGDDCPPSRFVSRSELRVGQPEGPEAGGPVRSPTPKMSGMFEATGV